MSTLDHLRRLHEAAPERLTISAEFMPIMRALPLLLDLAESVAGGFDYSHRWRCESWQVRPGVRLGSDPSPSDEKCDCGLAKFVAALNALEAE